MERDRTQEKLTVKGTKQDVIRTYDILRSDGKVPSQIVLKLAADFFASRKQARK